MWFKKDFENEILICDICLSKFHKKLTTTILKPGTFFHVCDNCKKNDNYNIKIMKNMVHNLKRKMVELKLENEGFIRIT